ncbi:uncharacterized protein PRCAT00001226001 [Priceomyces carsonii]|uniref:uncharacterized protein n=1 Tax=Priceomyces carsonii TaxID=28549 RepID=UPI002ED7C108|nr:unnamed protein product [Priceomyces carsonii]
MLGIISVCMISGWAVVSISSSVTFYVRLRRNQISKGYQQEVFREVAKSRALKGSKETNVIIYRLKPEEGCSSSIINVFNLNNGCLQYRFIKPKNQVNHEINLYWQQEFVLQEIPDKGNSAIIYSASIGKSGYIEFQRNATTNLKKEKVPVYQSILNRLKLLRSEDNKSQNNHQDEKIYISSKLGNELYEFKISGVDQVNEGLKFVYRWKSSTGMLKKVSRFDNYSNMAVAAIRAKRGTHDFEVEIDKSLMFIDIVLCTSLIFNSN